MELKKTLKICHLTIGNHECRPPSPWIVLCSRGQVNRVEGRIIRMVNECVGSDFGFVTSTGLLKHLATERLLLPFELAPVDSLNISNSTPPYVLESPKLPCISFSYERSFSALKAAALLHLTIQLRALEVGVPLPMPRPTIFRFKGPADVY